jgi:hypothetical protein
MRKFPLARSRAASLAAPLLPMGPVLPVDATPELAPLPVEVVPAPLLTVEPEIAVPEEAELFASLPPPQPIKDATPTATTPTLAVVCTAKWVS